jgi:hypothetical protein
MHESTNVNKSKISVNVTPYSRFSKLPKVQGYLETPKLRSHAQGYVLNQQRSSNQSRTLGDYHGHIFEAISQIQNYCEDTDQASFLANRSLRETEHQARLSWCD